MEKLPISIDLQAPGLDGDTCWMVISRPGEQDIPVPMSLEQLEYFFEQFCQNAIELAQTVLTQQDHVLH
jgi:hypothetical protein